MSNYQTKMQFHTYVYMILPSLTFPLSYFTFIQAFSAKSNQASFHPSFHIPSPLNSKMPVIGYYSSKYFIAVVVGIAVFNVWKAPDGSPAAEHRAYLFNVLPNLIKDAYLALTLANMSWVSQNPHLSLSFAHRKGQRLIDGPLSSRAPAMTGQRQSCPR